MHFKYEPNMLEVLAALHRFKDWNRRRWGHKNLKISRRDWHLATADRSQIGHNIAAWRKGHTSTNRGKLSRLNLGGR